MNPETHPFGETQFKHYDPEQVNTAQDAHDLFRWIAGENEEARNPEAAAVFRECADVIDSEVLNE